VAAPEEPPPPPGRDAPAHELAADAKQNLKSQCPSIINFVKPLNIGDF
jgi:hypothetical protein